MGITEYLASRSKPHAFYQVATAPGSVEPMENVFGTFLELENDQFGSLFPVVYDGDLVIRGNNNTVNRKFQSPFRLHRA